MSIVSDPHVQCSYIKHGDAALYVAVDKTDPSDVVVEVGFCNEVDGSKSECWHPAEVLHFTQ